MRPGQSSLNLRLIVLWESNDLVILFLVYNLGAFWEEKALRLILDCMIGLSLGTDHQIAVKHIILHGPAGPTKEHSDHGGWCSFEVSNDWTHKPDSTSQYRDVLEPLSAHCNPGG